MGLGGGEGTMRGGVRGAGLLFLVLTSVTGTLRAESEQWEEEKEESDILELELLLEASLNETAAHRRLHQTSGKAKEMRRTCIRTLEKVHLRGKGDTMSSCMSCNPTKKRCASKCSFLIAQMYGQCEGVCLPVSERPAHAWDMSPFSAHTSHLLAR